MIPSRLTLLAFLSACSDYDLKSSGDATALDSGEGALRDPCQEQDIPAVAIAGDDTCVLEPQTGQFEPEVLWDMSSFDEYPGSVYIMATASVGHITDDDGDGVYGSSGDVPDIAVITYGNQNVLRVISGDGTVVHWSVATDNPQGQGQVAIGDLDGDGAPELVVATEDGTIVAYRHNGVKAWESATLSMTEDWDWDGSDSTDIDEYCTAPAIADMDGDGTAEVIAGRAILDGSNGALLGLGEMGIGRAEGNVGTTSFAADVNLDGELEVVTGNALYAIDGHLGAHTNGEDGYVAVGNFDQDDKAEIIVVNNGYVTAYNHDFTVLWGPVGFGSSWGGPPTVADFDGDGDPEVGIAGASIYTVVDTDGSILWSKTVQDATSGVTGSSVFDFEGDGAAEVVYADEITLWAFEGINGHAKIESSDHASNTWLEYPTIADVNADGHADIVLGHNPWQGGKNDQGITVYTDAANTWTGTRQVWNQHAYSITNIEEDGSVPTYQEPNWLTYNNFRSNDMHAGQGALAPDLVPEIMGVCEEGCDLDDVWVWARARNEGAAQASAGSVLSVLSAGALADNVTISDPIPAGMTSPTYKLVVGRDEARAGLSAEVDSSGLVWECDEDNNVQTWDEDVCAE